MQVGAATPTGNPAKTTQSEDTAMSNGNSMTLVGNLTSDPELRFTQAGVAVTTIVLAHTERVFDRAAGEWKDGSTLFMRCTVWRNAGAENTAESLAKGSRVIVTGRLKQRTFTTDAGEKRTVVEMEVDEIAASLRFASAKLTRTTRTAARASGDSAWESLPPVPTTAVA